MRLKFVRNLGKINAFSRIWAYFFIDVLNEIIISSRKFSASLLSFISFLEFVGKELLCFKIASLESFFEDFPG